MWIECDDSTTVKVEEVTRIQVFGKAVYFYAPTTVPGHFEGRITCADAEQAQTTYQQILARVGAQTGFRQTGTGSPQDDHSSRP